MDEEVRLRRKQSKHSKKRHDSKSRKHKKSKYKKNAIDPLAPTIDLSKEIVHISSDSEQEPVTATVEPCPSDDEPEPPTTFDNNDDDDDEDDFFGQNELPSPATVEFDDNEPEPAKTAAESQPHQDPESLTHAKYLALIDNESRLSNGQVEPSKIIELRIGDWSVFRYKCWICETLHNDERTMIEHLKEKHADKEHKWQCSLCPKRVEPSTHAGYFLRHHVVRIHYPYLNFW